MHLPLESTNFASFSRADMILLDSWMQFKKCYVITRSINIWYRYTKIIKKSKFSVNKRTKGPTWFNSVFTAERKKRNLNYIAQPHALSLIIASLLL